MMRLPGTSSWHSHVPAQMIAITLLNLYNVVAT